MKLLTVILSLISTIIYSQNLINGDWEIKTTNYIFHPFEDDTLSLVKPPTIVNKITNEVLIITGNRNINLISFTNSIDAEYIPNFNQTIDTSFLIGYFSENFEDTLLKQYNSLAVIQKTTNIEFIFYNNLNSIGALPTKKETLEECISNGKKYLRLNYNVKYISRENIILIKNHL